MQATMSLLHALDLDSQVPSSVCLSPPQSRYFFDSSILSSLPIPLTFPSSSPAAHYLIPLSNHTPKYLKAFTSSIFHCHLLPPCIIMLALKLNLQSSSYCPHFLPKALPLYNIVCFTHIKKGHVCSSPLLLLNFSSHTPTGISIWFEKLLCTWNSSCASVNILFSAYSFQSLF